MNDVINKIINNFISLGFLNSALIAIVVFIMFVMIDTLLVLFEDMLGIDRKIRWYDIVSLILHMIFFFYCIYIYKVD